MPVTSMRRALILGNGIPPSRALFESFMRDEPLLLCADGGGNTAARYGYVPDYIVGDLDSLEEASKAGVAAEHIVCVDADDTSTDMHKALRLALELGVAEAVLVGFTGGRTDHILWNLSLLKTFQKQLRLRLVDDYCDIRLIDGSICFKGKIGQHISLCPLTGPVEEIETTGLKFALHGETLSPGIRDGISNEIIDNPVEIRVGKGDLLLVVQHEGSRGEIEVQEIPRKK